MSQPDAPKIEFPCKDYPIKIMGVSGDELMTLVLDVLGRHAPGFDSESMKVKSSSKGKFDSITVLITATGIEQLTALHEELKVNPLVKMVL